MQEEVERIELLGPLGTTAFQTAYEQVNTTYATQNDLRRTKAQVAKDLPQKIEVDSCRNLPMSKFQRQLYLDAVQSFHNQQTPAFSHHLGLIQYLRLVCCNPSPPGQKPSLHEPPLPERLRQSPKLAWLLDTLEKIQQNQEMK